jgi:Prophage CP4-57 regulatory protein (AlpA).
MKQKPYKSYDDLPLMLSVPNIATLLGISRAGAYELVRSQDFPAIHIGTRIVIPEDKLLLRIDTKSSEKPIAL